MSEMSKEKEKGVTRMTHPPYVCIYRPDNFGILFSGIFWRVKKWDSVSVSAAVRMLC